MPTALAIATACLVAAAFAGGRAAHAQHPVYQPKLQVMEKCLDAQENFSTTGQLMCIARERERQDGRMRTALDALTSQMPVEDGNRIGGVQKKWSDWREARCGFIDAGPLPGSLQRIEAALCDVNTLAERADELEAMLNSGSPAGTLPGTSHRRKDESDLFATPEHRP